MKTKHILQKWCLCLYLLVFFCVFPSVSTSTVRAQKVEMSIEQFNNLRQMVTELQKQSTEAVNSSEAVNSAETGLSEAQDTTNRISERADESASVLDRLQAELDRIAEANGLTE